MGKFLKELFEQYARRLLTTKVRPSISEEGIMTIPNNQRVKKMAENLYDDFQKAGVPNNILKTENDIKVFHHKIAEITNENLDRQFKTLMDESTLFNPKKSAEVFNLKGKKMDPTKPIIGGENIGLTHNEKIDWLVKNVDPNAERSIPPKATLEAMLKDGRDDLIDHFFKMHTKDLGKPKINIDTSGLKHPELVKKMMMDKKLKPTLVEKLKGQNTDLGKIDLPEIPKASVVKETEEQILARLQKGNKESLSNMRYEKAIKAEEAKAAADEDYIMKVLDPEDFSKGGRAGYYGGGQAMVGEDLSEIGHGSDALMARNMQLAPNSMATTSTGLNYLLGQDNETVRVPYNEGNMVLPKPKPKNFSKTLDMLNTKAAANTLNTKTYANLVGEFAKKAFDSGELSEVEYMRIIKPLFGEVGEMVTNQIQDDQNYLEKYAGGGVAGLLGEGPRSMDQEPRTNYKEAGVVDKIGGMVNYKNVPYYVNSAAKGATNIAEFVGKLPFAATELASDMIQKPLFKAGDKIPGLPGVGAKFVGGEMFEKFGDNIETGALAEKLGLSSLVEEGGKNLTPEARTVGGLLESGGEFVNIGGILAAGKNLLKGGDSLKKLSQSMGKVKDNKTLEKLVDETLTARGEGRRDFNKLMASGGVMVALQSIGLGGIKAAKTKSTPDAVLTLKTLIDDSDEMTENGPMAIGRLSSSIDVSGLTDAVKKSLAVIMKNSRTKFGDKVVRNKVKGKDGKFTDDYEDISTEEAAYIMEELQKRGHNVKFEHYDDMGGQGVDDILDKFKNNDFYKGTKLGKENYDKFSKKVAKMTDKEKIAYHTSITDDAGQYYDEFVEELLDMNFKNSTKYWHT
jgi:hypothetical protein